MTMMQSVVSSMCDSTHCRCTKMSSGQHAEGGRRHAAGVLCQDAAQDTPPARRLAGHHAVAGECRCACRGERLTARHTACVLTASQSVGWHSDHLAVNKACKLAVQAEAALVCARTGRACFGQQYAALRILKGEDSDQEPHTYRCWWWRRAAA